MPFLTRMAYPSHHTSLRYEIAIQKSDKIKTNNSTEGSKSLKCCRGFSSRKDRAADGYVPNLVTIWQTEHCQDAGAASSHNVRRRPSAGTGGRRFRHYGGRP